MNLFSEKVLRLIHEAKIYFDCHFFHIIMTIKSSLIGAFVVINFFRSIYFNLLFEIVPLSMPAIYHTTGVTFVVLRVPTPKWDWSSTNITVRSIFIVIQTNVIKNNLFAFHLMCCVSPTVRLRLLTSRCSVHFLCQIYDSF